MTEPEIKMLLNSIARHIENKTHTLFMLVLFDDPHICQYISNANRDDCIKAMEETAKRFKNNEITEALALLALVEAELKQQAEEIERLTDKGKKLCCEYGILCQTSYEQKAEIARLKAEIALACRSIERLCPPPMIGLIKLADGKIFNLTSAKQLAGLDLTKREPALAAVEEMWRRRRNED